MGASWVWAEDYLASWLGFALFFLLVAQLRPWQAFLFGGAIGAIALGVAFSWAPAALRNSTGIDTAASWIVFTVLGLWEAIPFALIAWFVSSQLSASVDRLWRIPVVWVALEAFWPKVLPWRIAYSQTDALPVLQITEVVGCAGVSFVLMYVAVLPAGVAHAILRHRTLRAAASVTAHGFASTSLLIVTLAFGYSRLHRWQEAFPAQGSIRIASIQVDPRYTDSIEKMRQRTLAVQKELDLALWPECALGVYSFDLCDFHDPERTLELSGPPLVELQPTEDLTCELLAGGKSYQPTADRDGGPFFQTAFLIEPDEKIAGRYFKRSLMPIGEYVPGQRFVSDLRKLADLDEVTVTGEDARPLQLREGTRIGILMCYEELVPNNARRTVAEGADILVTLANGTSFEDPLALEQHMRLALPRAIENRRYLVRCTATGVSCVIGPTGEVLQRLNVNAEGTLTADVPLLRGFTFYHRIGHLFGPGCILMSSVLLGLDWLRWRQVCRRTIHTRPVRPAPELAPVRFFANLTGRRFAR